MKHHFNGMEISDFVNLRLEGTPKYNKHRIDAITIEHSTGEIRIRVDYRWFSSLCTSSRNVELWTDDDQKGLIEQNRRLEADMMLDLMPQVYYDVLSNDDLQTIRKILEKSELLWNPKIKKC